jgi:hypothetical protein
MCGVGRLRIGSGQLHASTQSFPEPCILEARDPQASGSAQAKSSSLAQASRLLTLRLKRSAIFFSPINGTISSHVSLFSISLCPFAARCAADPQIFPPHIPTRIAIKAHRLFSPHLFFFKRRTCHFALPPVARTCYLGPPGSLTVHQNTQWGYLFSRSQQAVSPPFPLIHDLARTSHFSPVPTSP